jgi:hypothetical protein
MSLINLMVLGLLLFALGWLKHGAGMALAGAAIVALAAIISFARLFSGR